MRPLIHPQLINEDFGDPGLYAEFLFEKRAFLFDLGDIGALAPRKLLRVSHAFVTHAHMDHFAGFDPLLRVCLGRAKGLHLFGPAGFLDRVEHKLAAYSWNLVQNYASDFAVVATEVGPDGKTEATEFRCRSGFRRRPVPSPDLAGGILLDEEGFRVRTTVLDHAIPCLAFAIEERRHVNVWKNRLEEMGLAVGPWLRELKRAVLRGDADDAPVRAWWREGGEVRERRVSLGELKARILRIVPGQKIAYVVDAVYHEENARRIVDLARDADLLFIETPFLEEDRERAAARYHLTARQAGELARRAGVKRLVPFHFSPRYSGEAARLREEAQLAFSAPAAVRTGTGDPRGV